MNSRGVALPLALLALLFVLGTASLLLQSALLLREIGARQAEGGLVEAMATGSLEWRLAHWDSAAVAGLAVGGALELDIRVRGRMRAVDSVVRLGPDLLLLAVGAESRILRGPQATSRRVGQLVGLTPTGEVGLVQDGWRVLPR